MKVCWSAALCPLILLTALPSCSDDRPCPYVDARIIYVYPEAGPARDSARDSARPDSARPDSARSDSARSDSARPDSARPDSLLPDKGSSILMGPGPYSIAYAAKGVGFDYRSLVTAKFNSSNQMIEYKESARENPTVGTCKVGEAAMDPYVALGRWNGGTTGGVFYAITPGFTWNLKQGFHYVIGVQTTAPPTSGSTPYTLAHATAPTMADGSLALGTMTGKVRIKFSTTGAKVGLELSITMPGDATYKVATKGGVADPSKSEIKTTAHQIYGWIKLAAVGQACPSGCNVSADGFLAGPGAERLAMVVVINNNYSKAIQGAVVFKK